MPVGPFKDHAECVSEMTGKVEDPDAYCSWLEGQDMSTWSGVVSQENDITGDGRMIAPNALRWEQLPLPLRWVRSDVGAHDGAEVVGRVLRIWRDGNDIMAEGDFDMGSEVGVEAARQVAERLTTGVSLDLDDVEIELRVRPEDEDDPEALETDADGRVVAGRIDADAELYVIMDARVRAATLVATPAFAAAQISPSSGAANEDAEELVASGYQRPPSAAFKDPGLREPTPISVDEDGRVFGHIALWGSCHVGYGSECVSPPPSPSSYAYFRTGSVQTAEGTEVPVGRITIDTIHAGRRLGPNDAAAHYDHTGLAVADVAAGEDNHGIWISGMLRPGVTDEQRAVLQASPLSGDWRRIGGALELVGVLAVNTPGFPIPRALVSSGSVVSLVASGNLGLPDGLRSRVSDQAISKVRKAKLAARMKGR